MLRASSIFKTFILKGKALASGIKTSGPQRLTFAPNLCKACNEDLATLLCFTSPIILTFKPSKLPNSFLMVIKSKSACVGCSLIPAPALIKDVVLILSAISESKYSSDERTIAIPTPIDSKVLIVS